MKRIVKRSLALFLTMAMLFSNTLTSVAVGETNLSESSTIEESKTERPDTGNTEDDFGESEDPKDEGSVEDEHSEEENKESEDEEPVKDEGTEKNEESEGEEPAKDEDTEENEEAEDGESVKDEDSEESEEPEGEEPAAGEESEDEGQTTEDQKNDENGSDSEGTTPPETTEDVYYTVSVSWNPEEGGSVKALDEIKEGSDLRFTVTPVEGYEIASVMVDSEELEPNSENEDTGACRYAIENVMADIHIDVEFAEVEDDTEANEEVTGGIEDEKLVVEEETEEQEESQSFSYKKTINGVTISIYAEAGVLPDGTTAEIKEIKAEDVEGVSEEELEEYEEVYAYDITLYDADGEVLANDWAENGSVSVEFSGKRIEDVSDSAEKIDIIHVDHETNDVNVEEFEPADEIVYEVDHFSSFLIGVKKQQARITDAGVIELQVRAEKEQRGDEIPSKDWLGRDKDPVHNWEITDSNGDPINVSWLTLDNENSRTVTILVNDRNTDIRSIYDAIGEIQIKHTYSRELYDGGVWPNREFINITEIEKFSLELLGSPVYFYVAKDPTVTDRASTSAEDYIYWGEGTIPFGPASEYEAGFRGTIDDSWYGLIDFGGVPNFPNNDEDVYDGAGYPMLTIDNEKYYNEESPYYLGLTDEKKEQTNTYETSWEVYTVASGARDENYERIDGTYDVEEGGWFHEDTYIDKSTWHIDARVILHKKDMIQVEVQYQDPANIGETHYEYVINGILTKLLPKDNVQTKCDEYLESIKNQIFTNTGLDSNDYDIIWYVGDPNTGGQLYENVDLTEIVKSSDDPIQIYAIFKSKTSEGIIWLNYDKNNGEGEVPASVKYEIDHTDPIPLASIEGLSLDRDKAVLIGWSESKHDPLADKEAAESAKVESVKLDGANKTVYALWAEDKNNDDTPDYDQLIIEFDISADPDASFVIDPADTNVVVEGSTASYYYDLDGTDTLNAEAPNVTTTSGKTFEGWEHKSFGDYKYLLSINDGDPAEIRKLWSSNIITFTGKFSDPAQEKTYKVTYDANEGIGTPPVDEKEYKENEKAVLMDAENLSMEDATFFGWSFNPIPLISTFDAYENAEPATFAPGETITVTDDCKLYAVWVKDIQVIFDLDLGNHPGVTFKDTQILDNATEVDENAGIAVFNYSAIDDGDTSRLFYEAPEVDSEFFVDWTGKSSNTSALPYSEYREGSPVFTHEPGTVLEFIATYGEDKNQDNIPDSQQFLIKFDLDGQPGASFDLSNVDQWDERQNYTLPA